MADTTHQKSPNSNRMYTHIGVHGILSLTLTHSRTGLSPNFNLNSDWLRAPSKWVSVSDTSVARVKGWRWGISG